MFFVEAVHAASGGSGEVEMHFDIVEWDEDLIVVGALDESQVCHAGVSSENRRRADSKDRWKSSLPAVPLWPHRRHVLGQETESTPSDRHGKR